MGVLVTKFPKSWDARIVNIYLKSSALSEDHTFNKWISRFHNGMTVRVVIYSCLVIFGFYIKVSRRQFAFFDLLSFPVFYLLYMTLCYIYNFIYHKKRALTYKDHFNKILRCFTFEEEALTWKKYRKTFQSITILIIYLSYSTFIGGAVLSPLIRFTMKSISKVWTSFVLHPVVWYPTDVLSSTWELWIVLVVEALMFLYTVHFLSSCAILDLYSAMSQAVRFEALGAYLEKMTAPVEQLEDLDRPGPSNRIIFVQSSSTTDMDKLMDALQDLNILRRQTKLLQKAFETYTNLIHPVGMLVLTVLFFSAATEVRDNGISWIVVWSFTTAIGGLSYSFVYHYNAALVQDSHDQLLRCLWMCDWYSRDKEFRKWFLYAELAFAQPLKQKIFSFYSVNLYTFIKCLSTFWFIAALLYNISKK